MEKKPGKGSIILQVAILFLIGILTTGILTYVFERRLSNENVTRQTEQRAEEFADEARRAIQEFPAYAWLLSYWHTHADAMEIEYDVSFTPGTETEAKARALEERYPAVQLRYLTEAQLRAMPETDQKLYAEVAYSWLITRINDIKRAYHIDYLFCVASKEPFDTQFFLFSGADEGSVRGTAYEEVYPLGNVVTVAESQQIAMRHARDNASHLADAGDYVDHYTYLCSVDDADVFIGLTYSLSELRASVGAQTRTETVYAILNQSFLSLICLALIYFFVLRPLRGVQKNIRLYRETKNSGSVVKELAQIRPHNEIGQLSEDVSELALEIDQHLERIRSITVEKERISTELSLATKIQYAMLPHIFPAFPDRREFDIYAAMDPAKEVGGDFYDYFLVDPDHLCLLIADVSGKGVPAALFMMASKIMLQSCAMLGQTPAEILAKTNEGICSNNPEDMFITVWVGILEISTGRLTAANAGHEYPMLKKTDGGFELFKDKHGFVLGGMEGMRYGQYELTLEPGAKLFVYTDGVPEATDRNEALFGTERLLAALNEQPDASPEGLLNNVRHAVDEFVRDAEQFDDLTMLCLEYKGPQAGSAPTAEPGPEELLPDNP